MLVDCFEDSRVCECYDVLWLHIRQLFVTFYLILLVKTQPE